MFPEGRALEFLIAATVALIVVGPKDLPVLLRKLGQFMAKVRGMAAEFRASFDEMARQSELDDLRKEVEAMRKGQLADMTGLGDTQQHLDEISQGLSDIQLHPPMSYQYQPDADSEAAPKAKRARKAPAKAAPKAAPAKAAAPRKAAAPKTATVADAKPGRRKSAGTVS